MAAVVSRLLRPLRTLFRRRDYLLPDLREERIVMLIVLFVLFCREKLDWIVMMIRSLYYQIQ